MSNPYAFCGLNTGEQKSLVLGGSREDGGEEAFRIDKINLSSEWFLQLCGPRPHVLFVLKPV